MVAHPSFLPTYVRVVLAQPEDTAKEFPGDLLGTIHYISFLSYTYIQAEPATTPATRLGERYGNNRTLYDNPGAGLPSWTTRHALTTVPPNTSPLLSRRC
jgi:hypothetical protein